jgi:hypothetical protein
MGKITDNEIDEAVEQIIEAKMTAAEPEIKARKRTLVKKFSSYEKASRFLDGIAASGESITDYQIRRHSDGFCVFRREWVK